MKMRRLPETDLARICPHPADEKRRLLRMQKVARAPYSYDPTRDTTSDILNMQYGLLPAAERTSWEKVGAKIRAQSRSLEETDPICLLLGASMIALNRST